MVDVDVAEIDEDGYNQAFETFRRFDKDRNGYIDRVELSELLQDIDPVAWNGRAIDSLLKAIDINDDGRIQFDEFLRWVFSKDAGGFSFMPPETGMRFVVDSGCSVHCAHCGGQLFLADVAETGHTWQGMPASVFQPQSETTISIGDPFPLKMIQGDGTVAEVVCASCKVALGWKFIHSPRPAQTGMIGLMLPTVSVNAMEPQVIEVAPASKDGLDVLALGFMKQHGLFGLTATFQLGGHDPVSRGWGYANTEGLLMAADSRMRIASVSKPITAVALLRLVDAGMLDLDSLALPLINTRFGRTFETADSRVADITVRHLLHHVAGGWSNSDERGLPMFIYPECGHEQLIERIFAERLLEADPGTSYSYSNFGYCLLGRVVEAVLGDGRSYEEYVKQEVLAPCGIEGGYVDSIAASAKASKVGYYVSQSSDSEWSLSEGCLDTELVTRMDSHGGWVLSAPDLVRFSNAVENGTLLSEGSLTEMVTPHPSSSGYGMGWCINSHARWHNGVLEGTGSIVVRTSRGGGMTWALLVNTGHGCDALDAFAWTCISAVQEVIDSG